MNNSKTSIRRVNPAAALRWGGVLGMFFLHCAQVQAGEPTKQDRQPTAFVSAEVVADQELKAIAGKADLQQSVVANNTSNVSNNSVNGDSTTGTINLANNAFQNLHGLSVLSANTGNNVSINASLNVNVALRP